MLKNVIFTYFATAKVVLSYCTELLSILIINSQSDSKSNSISIKSAFSTQFPLPVKTKARSRGVTGGTKILRNTFPTRTGVTPRVSSSRSEDVFSEESDSNALGLVYDSDGDNPESLGESGPHPGSLTICAA